MTGSETQKHYFAGDKATTFYADYVDHLKQVLDSVDNNAVEESYQTVSTCIRNSELFSLPEMVDLQAIANHLCCDWTKAPWLKACHM